MNLPNLTPSLIFSLVLAAIMLAFSCADSWVFPCLSLEHPAVEAGQLWRILTANFVHFGWAHTAMNVSAFLICSYALLSEMNLFRFMSLLMLCCLSVGIGIYGLNPELGTYAGLSGAIHGLIIAGLLQTKLHPLWMRAVALVFVVIKIAQEQSPHYQATDLQNLMPVPVAVDAHLYGALAGLAFVGFDWSIGKIRKEK